MVPLKSGSPKTGLERGKSTGSGETVPLNRVQMYMFRQGDSRVTTLVTLSPSVYTRSTHRATKNVVQLSICPPEEIYIHIRFKNQRMFLKKNVPKNQSGTRKINAYSKFLPPKLNDETGCSVPANDRPTLPLSHSELVDNGGKACPPAIRR